MTQHAPSKVTITLNGRDYVVTCDAGEERKLADLVKIVDSKLADIAGKSSNASETRLFMLACLMLADELQETRKAIQTACSADEAIMVAAVNHLKGRIEAIASMVG